LSSSDWLLAQSLGLMPYRPHWLGDPTLPLAVSSAVWSFRTRLRWSPFSHQQNPLSSFASDQSRTEFNLAARPQPAGSSHGLPLPTAHEESKVHYPQARPPATFRLQGLATLLTVCALRSRAGSVSHRQRSWDSPFGAFASGKVSGGIGGRINPPTVSLAGDPAAEAMGRPG